MSASSKYSGLLLNLLFAVVISVVVNFSTVLAMILESNSDQQQNALPPCVVEKRGEGILRVHPDGYGYLIYEGGDTVYVSPHRIRRWELKAGDRLEASVIKPRAAGAHSVLFEVSRRNGKEFDSPVFFNRPSAVLDHGIQLLFYAFMTFVLLSVVTHTRYDFSTRAFARRCFVVLLLGVVLYFVAPATNYHRGTILPNFLMGRWINYLLLMKCSFTVVVVLLYGRIYLLLYERQAVVVENEKLKNENLTTRYNMLVGQINPHYFFNSLNSLAMLVRESEREKALEYIDRLSYTFRYIIRNGQSTLMTLEEELQFATAFEYLYKIRYEDKLFFETEVADEYLGWRLPALSLQPLLGNAVKHNVMTRSNPLRVSIRTDSGWLVVSNPKHPKLDEESSTGIGLENLRNRWRLIAGCEIEIEDSPTEFVVRLPLLQPETQA